MKEDWRQIHRKPNEPDVSVGDLIPGMEQDADGQWVGIVAPVEAVELLESNADGSRVYRVLLGKSVRIETPQ
jgi:hypothetical protein